MKHGFKLLLLLLLTLLFCLFNTICSLAAESNESSYGSSEKSVISELDETKKKNKLKEESETDESENDMSSPLLKDSHKEVLPENKTLSNEEDSLGEEFEDELIEKKADETADSIKSDSVDITPHIKKAPLMLNLEKSIQTALENHSDIKIAKARILDSEGRYMQARSSNQIKVKLQGSYTRTDPIPEFSLPGKEGESPTKVKMGIEDYFSGRVILEKVISTFGNLENTIAASALSVAASRENYETVKQNVILQVKEKYFDVLRAQKRVKIAEYDLDIVREQLRISNDMYDSGVVPRYEVLKNKLYLSQARQYLISAEKNRKLAVAGFLDTLALDLETDIVLKDTQDTQLIKVDQDLIREMALENRHELKFLELSLEASKRILEGAVNSRNPTLSFQSILENKTVAGLAAEPTSLTNMLVLSIPFIDGGEIRAKIIQAEAAVKELEETLNMTRRQITLEVKQTVLAIDEAEAKVETALQNTETAFEGYKIALTRFENGISTGVELDDARRTLNLAKIEYLNIIYEYHLAVARLEKAVASSLKGDNHQ